MSALTDALVPLIGVAFGTGGTVLGQYLPTRASKDRIAAAEAAALRAELKEAILDFLKICQVVERTAERRSQEGQFIDGSPEQTHDMWFRQKALTLVASPDLNQAALDYAFRLAGATYGRVPPGVDPDDYTSEKRGPFLDAARKALGIPLPV